jgi:hypothetical protein
MKLIKISTIYLSLVLYLCVGCIDTKPKTKYSIYVPSRVAYGGGWYNVNSYKSLENGAIEFSVGNRIYRSNDFDIIINY